MGEAEIKRIMELVPGILDLIHNKVWMIYDKEADVLYIDFKKPSHADDTEITEDNVLIRYEKDEVVGITIMNASQWRGSRQQ